MNERLEWIQQEINGLKEAGLFNRIRTISSAQGAWLTVDDKRVLNFCSNNYLGLANHPRLVAKARENLEKYGCGPAAVRTIAGTLDLHLELERRLAVFKGVECGHHLSVRFFRQPGDDWQPGGQRRCDFLGRAEPRQHH